VERSRLGRQADHERRSTFRLLISNVLMENEEHDRLLRVIEDADPDVVLTVETNARWAEALEPLAEKYPHVVRQPQENYYGMILFSRLPIVDAKIEFMVQEDIPSVHAVFELPSGQHVTLHGLHPRPPEPLRDQDSTPRDAELVLMGRAIRAAGDVPTVVAGDLNDVAWSPVSELFLRLSGLLDPRVGRGFFNSYNANNPIFRYPLDHVFHSNHFRLCELRRLPNIGSDHFPMLVELSYEPDASSDQPRTPVDQGDMEEAEEKIELEVEAARTGDDRPGRE
jgi:endonuclease/exonuclease/phosphatase (EEP) superfamily protein YafD